MRFAKIKINEAVAHVLAELLRAYSLVQSMP